MKKIKLLIFFILVLNGKNFAQTVENFYNPLIVELNHKIDELNALSESVGSYNRRIYQYYIKRDSISYGRFMFTSPSGNLINDKSKRRKNRRNLEDFIQQQNQPKLSKLVSQLHHKEKKIYKRISTFSTYREYNFSYYLDSTNVKFEQIRNLLTSMNDDMVSIKEEIHQIINPKDTLIFFKENKISNLLFRAKDSIRYGTIASTYPIIKELQSSEYRNLSEKYDKKRIEEYIYSLNCYHHKKELFNFQYFINPYYFNSKYVSDKTKIHYRFYNHLVHLLATSTINSESFIDTYNNFLLKNSSSTLLVFKPMVLLDQLYLTVNTNFGLNRKTMPEALTLILVDVSGSMKRNNKLEEVKKSLNKIIELQQPKELLSVIVFSDFVTDLFKLDEKDLNYKKEIINKISSFQETNPEFAIQHATHILKSSIPSRTKNKIILITDGGFKITDQMNKSMYQIKGKRTNFSIMLLNNSDEKTKKLLEELTTINEGKVYQIQDLNLLTNSLIQEMNREVVPSYEVYNRK